MPEDRQSLARMMYWISGNRAMEQVGRTRPLPVVAGKGPPVKGIDTGRVDLVTNRMGEPVPQTPGVVV